MIVAVRHTATDQRQLAAHDARDRTLHEQVEQHFALLLSAREARVLRLRFGIGQQACSVAHVARRMDIRISTVLRLQARALAKLRADACGSLAKTLLAAADALGGAPRRT